MARGWMQKDGTTLITSNGTWIGAVVEKGQYVNENDTVIITNAGTLQDVSGDTVISKDGVFDVAAGGVNDGATVLITSGGTHQGVYANANGTVIITANGTLQDVSGNSIISKAGVFNVEGGGVFKGSTAVVGTDGSVNLKIGGLKVSASTDLMTANGTLVSQNVGGQKVLLPFGQLNIVTNLSATVITPLGGSSTLSEFIMDRGGSIIGVVAYLNASITAGTITVSPTIDGTTKMTATIAATNNATAATQNRGTDTFTAKQRIGLKLTSTTNIAPETTDLSASVVVEI